ncbi:GQ67_02009T0 [Komagataella phaffii]|nr:GQ67_02009T0 [Komagataella phaffii]AOA66682.1 GQ68_02024T0 [Komagataella phaffii GS115]
MRFWKLYRLFRTFIVKDTTFDFSVTSDIACAESFINLSLLRFLVIFQSKSNISNYLLMATSDYYDSEEELDLSEDDLEFDLQDLHITSQDSEIEFLFKSLTSDVLWISIVEKADHVAAFIGMTRDECLVLLQHYDWREDKVLDDFLSLGDEIKVSKGLALSSKLRHSLPLHSLSRICAICCEQVDQMFHLEQCSHEYCVKCYTRYLSDKLRQQDSLVLCMEPSCSISVSLQDLKALDSNFPGKDHKPLYDIMISNIAKNYVESNPKLKWCPAPDCTGIVQFDGFSTYEIGTLKEYLDSHNLPIVTCPYSHSFCFACSYEDHDPIPCNIAKNWIRKSKDDSETANWIDINTKQCPKCDAVIEKNGGCNHMTCKKCAYQFCWICLQDWPLHGTAYYNCSRYDASAIKEMHQKQQTTKQSLKRYLHYYKFYISHELSAHQDNDLFRSIESRVQEMQQDLGISWIDCQFYRTAMKLLIKSRKVLKWSYALLYYCEVNNYVYIVETNQSFLSNSIEDLSHLFQLTDPKCIVRERLQFINLSNSMKKREAALVEIIHEGLKNQHLKVT